MKDMSEAKRRLLEQRMRGFKTAPKEAIKPRAAGSRTPISAEQHRIWLHTAMDPEVPIYNEAITIHRCGDFDLAALEAAFNEILDRHEAWRTSFKMEDGELLQIDHPGLKVKLEVTDLTHLPQEERAAEAYRLTAEIAEQPFDLKTAPLFRATVYRMAPDDHWLQLNLHHIIFDGVSLYRTFVPELAELYDAIVTKRRSRLAAPTLQYGDYSVWREQQVKDPLLAKPLEYWRSVLSGELPVLRLPLDRPRPAVMSHRGAMEGFTFPQELVTSLRTMSRNHGVTLYMTLLAGLKTLFFRYSGQEDVIVGGLADGRRRPEFEGLMGYFLDTFAIRTRPRADVPFTEYLAEVRNSVLGALAAAEVPFSTVLRSIAPYRDHSVHPIFQTFLSVQPQAEAFPEGWEISKTPIAVTAAKFDLYIEVEERPDQTKVRLMYSTDLFDAPTVQRIGDHWMTILSAAAEAPETLLGDLPVLTPAEETLMLHMWNQQERPFPADTLHSLVRDQVRRTPSAPAVEFEGNRWSYAELEETVELLAGHLRKAGARRGTLVAVCLERSQFLPASLLAILRTGAAYLPLDPGTPRARRLLCMEDAAPVVLLTQRSLRDDLPAGDATVLLLEEAIEEGSLPDDGGDPVVNDLGDAAYVIHTSGSTGRPKAVEISHRALVNLLVTMADKPGFTAGDTLLAVTTISFDIAGLELFLPLLTGGRVVIASRAVALDPYLLTEAIEESACTVLQATPATWRGLLATGWDGRQGLRVLCGGEAMPRELANSLLALDMEVWNVYGPTETTIWSTVHRVSHGTGPIPVGRPIANTTTYILDARQRAVPIGVPGELYIGGTGLANCYRDQPALTAEKFVYPALASGARLYRTGDYAVYRADGRIEVQGRADNQVKVRGYRIELEDVESSLAAHPRVAAAVAKVWPDPSGGNRLSAYLVGKQGPPPDAAEMREFLKTRMPDYMIPSDVIALDAMPLTSNGKMDRKALVSPVFGEKRAVTAAPSTETELKLATIWTDLLGVASVGVTDNFFDLGGHSLLVARLQQRIAVDFEKKVAMAAIFHAPTISGQAALLQERDHTIDRSRLLPLQPNGARAPLFWLQPPPLINNLAASLGKDQPLLGVTITLGDLEQLGPEPNFEELARCFTRTIQKAQPTGPYYLGGLCTSGILAYEVAAQLTAAGETVALMAMLDAENPVFYRRLDTLAVEMDKLRFYGRRALRKRGSQMFMRHMRSRLRRLVRLEEAAATEMSAIESALLAAAFQYKPPVYTGEVLLMLPKERPMRVDYLSGWQVVIQGKLTCTSIAGHHDELLDVDYAGGVAKALLDHLGSIPSANSSAG